MKNVYYTTQFGLLCVLALWEETVCTQTHSLPGGMPLAKAGAVGSTGPRAAVSTRSELWVD